MDGRTVTAFRFAFGAAVAGCLSAEVSAQGKEGAGKGNTGAAPEVWLCTGRAFDLARPDARWDSVKSRLAGIQLYIDNVNKAKREDLEALVQVVEANGLKVSVECGGTLGFAPLDDSNGEQSARIELAKIAKWYGAGGTVDYLNLDGPVRRLLYPRRGKKTLPSFGSIEDCANELMDYMRAVKAAHPRMRFFLLTNFPNWGYRGGVSYHGRGDKQQDWGDYHEVVTTVLKVAEAAGLSFAGVTVDNPYEYLIGEHFSVKNEDPSKVDWLGRVRAYENFARSRGLEFNLIVNSQEGGKVSDRAFFERTLKMLDAYTAAGGRPTRCIVQSWYTYPRAIVPEEEPYSMTALVKAVIERLDRRARAANGGGE